MASVLALRIIMKRIRDETTLTGKLEVISMTELREQPGEVMASVVLGKVWVVTKQGKPFAVISKVPGVTLTLEVASDGTGGFRLPDV
jgi:hypothetical protein